MSTEIVQYKPSTELKKIVKTAIAKLDAARDHVVNGRDTYVYADTALTSASSDLKKLKAFEKIATSDVAAELKTRKDYFAASKKALEAAKTILGGKLQVWNARQEAVAAAAQREANKAAVEVEKAAKKAAADATKDLPVEVRKAAVQMAEDTSAPATIIKSATPVGTTKYRDHWVVEVDDLGAAIKHIAKNLGTPLDPDNKSLDFLLPNTSVLNAKAKSIKVEGELIPGFRIVNARIPVN